MPHHEDDDLSPQAVEEQRREKACGFCPARNDAFHCPHEGDSFANMAGHWITVTCCYCGHKGTREFTRGKNPSHGPYAPDVLIDRGITWKTETPS